MAVIVTDRRTIINNADTVTGWNQGAVVTTFFAEATGCIAVGNNAPEQIYFTTTAQNATSTLIYVYAFNNGLQNLWDNATNPPVGLLIGDGTNIVSFNMAGDDKKVFVHSDGPTAWQNLVLDTDVIGTMNTNGYTTVRAGTFAGLNVGTLTQFGGDYESLSKALGGGYNMATDIIRIGNNGLRITGGGIGTEGNLLEIAIEDRSTAAGKAHGLIRELIAGVFGCQGPLTFGDSGVATDSRFLESGVVLSYEARDIANDKYYLNVEGNVGSTNNFTLTNSTITTAGPFVSCNFASGNINIFNVNGNTFSALGNSITFSNLGDAVNHTAQGCTFNGCGRIDPGTVSFSNNVITNSTNLDGAMLLDGDGTTNLSNLTFNRGEGGHGIIITTPGTYSFTNFTFNEFGANDTTTAGVYNNSGGAVTINVSGGTSPTVRNGAGSTTTVLATVSITLTGLRVNTEVRVYTNTIGDDNGDEIAGVENSGTSFTFDVESGEVINIMINNLNYLPADIWQFLVPSASATIPISQFIDRNYFNPP